MLALGTCSNRPAEAAKSRLDLQAMLLSEADRPGWPGLVGRLDRERLGQMLRGLDPARSVALICGPGPMVTAVSDALLDLGMPMENVIYERFDYSAGGASRQDRRRRRLSLSLWARPWRSASPHSRCCCPEWRSPSNTIPRMQTPLPVSSL